jgi:hypothetical protein
MEIIRGCLRFKVWAIIISLCKNRANSGYTMDTIAPVSPLRSVGAVAVWSRLDVLHVYSRFSCRRLISLGQCKMQAEKHREVE